VGQKRAVLIAGPTASGKSALALEKARALSGIVINADALQVYDGLRIVTARPDDQALAEAPHRLYGTVPATTRFSTGDWLRAARREIAAAGDRPLIFAGGTGLYFEALTKGIAEIPEVSPEALAAAEAEVHGLDREQRGRLMAARDPEIAARLKAPDPQRVIRALAVLNATGRSLARFQDDAQTGSIDGYALERIVLNPDRAVLRQRIHDRFVSMLDRGAIAEVEGFAARGLDPTLPISKAIGVREIGDFIAGRIDREAMIEQAVTATRQYAKRQRTWFRGRMSDWTWIEA